MSNDMSETITGAAIPDNVMAEAARAICDQNDAWWEDAGPLDREVYVDYVRAALPILMPAIEKALVERMISDVSVQRGRWNGCNPGAYASHDGTFDDAPCVLDARDIADAIREYLPTEDEETDSD